MNEDVKKVIIEIIDEYNRTNYKLDIIERDINTLKTSIAQVSDILNDKTIMNSQEIFDANINDIEKKLIVLETDKVLNMDHLEKIREKESHLMEYVKLQPNFNPELFKNNVFAMINENTQKNTE